MDYNKLAKKIASSYKVQDGVTSDDLVQSALLGILEAELRWKPEDDVSFTTVAYRYAKNELNNLIYKQTTRQNLPTRISRNKEEPQGFLADEKVSDDDNYSRKLEDEIMLIAEDVLTRKEYEMFTLLYNLGDRQAVSLYRKYYNVTRRQAYSVKQKVREKMKEHLSDCID